MNYPRRILEIVAGVMAVVLVALGAFEMNPLTVIGMLCALVGVGLYARTELFGFGRK